MTWRDGMTEQEYDREMSRISYLSRKRVFNDLPELYETSLKANDNYYLTRDLIINELKNMMLVHKIIDEAEFRYDYFYLCVLDVPLKEDDKYIYFYQVGAGKTDPKRVLNNVYCSHNGQVIEKWIDRLFEDVVNPNCWTLK